MLLVHALLPIALLITLMLVLVLILLQTLLAGCGWCVKLEMKSC